MDISGIPCGSKRILSIHPREALSMKRNMGTVAAVCLTLLVSGCDRILSPLDGSDGHPEWRTARLPEGRRFASVRFLDEKHGWIAGAEGALYSTRDGGETWDRAESGTEQNLTRMEWADGLHGWIAAVNGVLSTADGGRTWRPTLSGVELERFAAMSFVDAETGWVSGSPDGIVYRTVNGGTDWTPLQAGTAERVVDLSFTDRNNGFALGSIAGLLRTRDGGLTWTRTGTPRFCSCVRFLTPLLGFAADNVMLSSLFEDRASIFRTEDGGETWTESAFPEALTVWRIEFTDPVAGVAMAGGLDSWSGEASDWVRTGDVVRTKDGCRTWVSIGKLTGASKFVDFHAIDGGRVFLITLSGELGCVRF
jgi:photosystem II stability/assembly factor-like uncharacterized protein